MSDLHTFYISMHTLFDSIWRHLLELILLILWLDMHTCSMALHWTMCCKPRLNYCLTNHVKAKQLCHTNQSVYAHGNMYLYTCTCRCNQMWSDQHILCDRKLDCYIVYAHHRLSVYTYHHYSDFICLYFFFAPLRDSNMQPNCYYPYHVWLCPQAILFFTTRLEKKTYCHTR